VREGEWEGVANFAPNTRLEYKFLLVNDSGDALRWEDGPNRGFSVSDVDVELGEVWRVQLLALALADGKRALLVSESLVLTQLYL
jgi:hypothetical protein